MSRLVVKLGKGWHVRLGPVLLSHFTPCSASPRVDQAWTTFSYADDRPDTTFRGWAFRSPPFVIAFAGRLGHYAGWLRRRRDARRARRPAGPTLTATRDFSS